MTLSELLKHNENALAFQESLTIAEQIKFLSKHKKSVFTFHMLDGRKLVRGDSESDKKEMQKFFNRYPQTGCEWIEFHK